MRQKLNVCENLVFAEVTIDQCQKVPITYRIHHFLSRFFFAVA